MAVRHNPIHFINISQYQIWPPYLAKHILINTLSDCHVSLCLFRVWLNILLRKNLIVWHDMIVNVSI
ncbi:hypothetical protein MGSAQ_000226 [marine sediment metagenome]|uniref:Uncharacterized protein n=1 Tax=marine sediment metagenome TaxID=412755 RepID=A0A1B6NY20_9ZZZZ